MVKINKFIMFAVFILCIQGALFAQSYVWGPTPLMELAFPDSSLVTKVIADPADPNIVWGLTANMFDPFGSLPPDPADGLFKSTDKGAHWTRMNDSVLLSSYSVVDIAICKSNNKIIYAGTFFQGVFKSTNGGTSWAKVNSGLTYGGASFPSNKWAVLAVGVDPADPNKAYCSIAQISEIDLLSLSLDHPGFYKTTNGGTSWSASNTGLPTKTGQKTAVVANIQFVPQNTKYMVCGMIDVEAKFSLFASAKSKGRVFYSANNGSSFTEISNGFPTVSAEVVLLGASVSASIVYVTPSPAGSGITLYASHLGGKGSISLTIQTGKLNSGGVYKLTPPSSMTWAKASTGLPVINDDYNENSTNTGAIAASPLDSKIALVGVFLSDMGIPTTDNNKVWATTNGGTWTKKWDSGMSVSPHGYYYAVPIYTVFNTNQTAAYCSVHWEDENNIGDDSGVWRLPALTDNYSDPDVESASFMAQGEIKTVKNPFASLPFPLNMFKPIK